MAGAFKLDIFSPWSVYSIEILQLFVTLGNLIGYHGVFFLYAAVSAASYVFVLCFVPVRSGQGSSDHLAELRIGTF